MESQTPIMRLRQFIDWTIYNKLCKSVGDFERKCRLTTRYVSNNMTSGKGNIGSEIMGRIVSAFPQLDLVWLCSGKGAMLVNAERESNMDYKLAYEGAVLQIEALNKIIARLEAGSGKPIASPLS